VYHVLTFYSRKAASDKTYIPVHGFPQHRLPLEHPIGIVAARAACIVPLVLGNLQFVPEIRKSFSFSLHKAIGRMYVFVYLIGAVGPLYMVFYMAHCSLFLKIAIAALGLAWAGTTLIALQAVLSKQISLHRQWMARSFLISHTVPLLFRFVWGIAVIGLGLEEQSAFEVCGLIIAALTLPLCEKMAQMEARSGNVNYVHLLHKENFKVFERSKNCVINDIEGQQQSSVKSSSADFATAISAAAGESDEAIVDVSADIKVPSLLADDNTDATVTVIKHSEK